MDYKLVFTSAQITILDRALQALPYGQVVELYQSIKNQIEEQHAATQGPVDRKIPETETIGAD